MDDYDLVDRGFIRNPTDQKVGAHLSRVSDHVSFIIKKYQVEEVIIEDLFIQFLTTGKKILQIHGAIKAAVFRHMQAEAFVYPQQTWRAKLGIKNLTKKEKEALIPAAKKVKGERYKTYHKYLCDVKHRVVAYVNQSGVTSHVFTFEENDVTDAIGLILAHMRMDK